MLALASDKIANTYNIAEVSLDGMSLHGEPDIPGNSDTLQRTRSISYLSKTGSGL